jgi:hypothetical protein
MKRSEINRIIELAEVFLAKRCFVLPPFASWSASTWPARAEEAAAVVARRLGWDITDFGRGDFRRTGLVLFTLRNGDPADLGRGRGMLYGEKVLIVEPDQATPLHLHRVKTEDIINRGGGRLALRLYNASEDGAREESPVVVWTDGMRRVVPAGDTVVLGPGESVTLPDGLYHEFWGVDDRVLVGEVSLVNDDATDNYFYEDVGRFPEIVEDEPPHRLLVGDYERYAVPDG